MAQNLSKKVFLELDTTGLKPAHIRLVKTLYNMIAHALTTEDEGEYFNSSAETIRLCASLIKQARFIETMEKEKIPYAEQALEFSVDILQEHIANSKVVTYDC